nr:desmoglein-2.1 [Misgurnus anguillicaudatus]
MLYSLLCLIFLLFFSAQSNGDCRILSNKKRHKREWVIPSRKVTENVDYTHDPYVAKIRSDMSESLYYTLKGPGADEPPIGLFVIDEQKGMVRLTRPLDREEREIYTLRAIAWFSNNSIAEGNIKINVTVEDQNDNLPKFIKSERGSVYEGSPAGTFVMQVVAKDEDQPGTLNSKIAYTLVKQEPNKGKLYFGIDKDNGTIFVKDPTLDREEQDSYMLTLHAADMYGSAEGNVDTTTVFIDILDINDNFPTLENNEFSASIDENVAHMEVLKIQALDADEKRTDNWLAVFEIVSGNEDGRFSVETDHRTNMGVVFLNKAVDFESVSNLNLSLAVANKAPPGAPLGSAARSAGPESLSASEQKLYLLKINVENKRDGPKFDPTVKFVSVSEDIQNNSIPGMIATYTAIDEDTGKTAEKVKYAKGYDPDNWVSVDKDTAEITLHTVPDRESPFVVNGTYYVKILCITDEIHSRTSTGTIGLQVENINDICPKLTDNVKYVCSDDKVVNITAEDNDADPYGAPLEFILKPEKTTGKWSLQKINDVSVALLTYGDLWPGYYQVTMEIKDSQGLACPDEQVLQFEVCTCSKKSFCSPQVVVTLGEPVIVLLVLEILFLLLLALILIKCKCGGDAFIDMPFETKACFISYNTEGIGEDKDVLLMSISPKFTCESGNELVNASTATVMNFKTPRDEIPTPSSHVTANVSALGSGMMPKMFGGLYYDVLDMQEIPVNYEDINYALPDAILKEYFMQKARCISGAAYSEDKPMNYTYEGERSGTDSLSTCICDESDDELELLNDLGPKFHTLGELCGLRRSPSVSTGTQAEPKVINNTVMTKPATHETPVNAGSSSHVTKTVQPIPVEKSLPVQATPNDELVTPVYYTINKPISSNVLLSENLSFGHGQGVYIINRSSETEGQNIDHPIMCSQITPYIPVMVRQGLGEIISIPNLLTNQNLAMLRRPMLIGSPQLVEVPEGLVVSGEYGQGTVNLRHYFTVP